MTSLNDHAAWACPHCRETLTLNGDTWVCSNNHPFDRAKEGYVNLLPANFKRSKIPGDSPEMIAARRRMHDAAIYAPLAEELCATVAKLCQLGSSTDSLVGSLLDLGCGEGYYDALLTQHIPGLQLMGIDIAKSAVRMAAKRNHSHQYAVASSNHLPVVSNSIDIVLRIFAPSNDAEVWRVLKHGGYYIEVGPAPRHLWELREALYDTPRPHAESRTSIDVVTDDHTTSFALVATETCHHQQTLGNALLNDLLMATPFAYRGHREKREALRERDNLAVSMAFQWRVFQRPFGA